jgi:mono/diheme cytochrome c family protein
MPARPGIQAQTPGPWSAAAAPASVRALAGATPALHVVYRVAPPTPPAGRGAELWSIDAQTGAHTVLKTIARGQFDEPAWLAAP